MIYTKSSQNITKKIVGGKAYYLYKIASANIISPKFFVLSVSFTNKIIHPIREKIEILLSSELELHSIAAEIALLFESLSFSKVLSEEIENKFEAFFKNQKVAVRSSAVDEDSFDNSFAGQHMSFMYVDKPNLVPFIKKSIASAWSINALAYRKNRELSRQHICIAIIVQEMIDAEKSGIGFSMNVQGNMDDMILTTGYGLGEGIVSDQVVTDTYYIARNTNNIKNEIRCKNTKLVYAKTKGLSLEKLEKSKQKTAILDSNEIIQIKSLLQKTEQLLGTPSDIEFSFTKDRKLFLLQMRPITGINKQSIKILDNTNIAESYPEISLPLTFSFVKNAYSKVFKHASSVFWISKELQNSMDGVFKNLLGYHQGRVYYRLDNWYRMMSKIFPSKTAMQSWENAVGLKADNSEKEYLNFGNKFKIYFSIIRLLWNYKRGNRQFYKNFNRNLSELKSNYHKKTTVNELLILLKNSSDKINRYWYITLINDLISFKSFDMLQNRITKNKIGAKEMANDLLSGQIHSKSEDVLLSLLAIKLQINKNKELSKLFKSSNLIILKALRDDKFKEIKIVLDNHLEKYGDRMLSELKLEVPSLKQDRDKFIHLIKNQLTSKVNLLSYKKHQEKMYADAIIAVDDKLRYWNLKRWFFNWIKNTTIYGLRNRENMRFARTQIYGVSKNIYLKIGRIIYSQGDLNKDTDIFYLTTDELDLYNKDNKSLDWKKIVIKRKATFEHYKNLQVADRIIYTSDIPPSLSLLKNTEVKGKNRIFGTTVSNGVVTAKAKIILNPDYAMNVQGNILVTKGTDPGWVFLMTQASGLISERGSLLSHTAIVGRELGIPVIVGVSQITSILKDGDVIKMDGTQGSVEILTN